MGKVVDQINLGVREGSVTETLNLSGLAKGTYVVRVNSAEGNKTAKLLKQ
jgi:hypothetical protein